MEAFPSLSSFTIGDDTLPTVNARDLHTFLDVGRDFSTWMKTRIDEYGFQENQDFTSFPRNGGKPQGGRPTIDYHLTLDMAKELAMVERTEQGRRVRRYFIECERRLMQQSDQPVALTASGATERTRLSELVGYLCEHPQGVETDVLLAHTTSRYGLKTSSARRLLSALRKVPGVVLAELGKAVAYRVVEGELVDPPTLAQPLADLPTFSKEQLEHTTLDHHTRVELHRQMDRFFHELRSAGVQCEGVHRVWGATYHQLVSLQNRISETARFLSLGNQEQTPLWPQ